MDILILVTGGTLDKEYNEFDGSLYFRESHLQEMLDIGRCRLSVRLQQVMLKDSLDMLSADRGQILNACQASPETRIVITHGTDTLEQTARFLADRITDRTVVLTGAMIPYAFGRSDALFNLGSALSFVQTLPIGVYVAMNGCCFEAHAVRKDRVQGVFVATK